MTPPAIKWLAFLYSSLWFAVWLLFMLGIRHPRGRINSAQAESEAALDRMEAGRGSTTDEHGFTRMEENHGVGQ